MKTFVKQKQVCVVYPNKYDIVYTNTDPKKVVEWAKKNRESLKKKGATKVFVNIGLYEKK